MKWAIVQNGVIVNVVYSDTQPDDGVEVTEESLVALSELEGFEIYFPPEQAAPTLSEILLRTAAESRNISDSIIGKIKAANLQYFLENSVPNEQALVTSLWVHHRLRAIEFSPMPGMNVTIDLMNLVVSGDLETAYMAISAMQLDDMSQPYHYFNQERIDYIKGLIAEGLGW